MTPPILEARRLGFRYRTTAPILSDINVAVTAGRNIGIVGESGSGKSTLLRLLLGILSPTKGQVLFSGKELLLGDRNQALTFRSQVQVVFQDPYSSLDPRQRIDRLIAEPLHSLGLAKKANALESRAARGEWVISQVEDALLSVGLPADSAYRYPDEFSGGQRQRIAIAQLSANLKFFLQMNPSAH
jgi:ABC-type dipeptide/oligopeptide/nickel transport system ATPase subunit